MRHSARITALVLSVILAASVAPVAADAAAPASPDGSTPTSIDLGDDMVSPPAKLRARTGSKVSVIPTPGVAVEHKIDLSVVTVSGADGGDANVTVPTTRTEAEAFVKKINDYWTAESNGDITIVLDEFETNVQVTADCAVTPTEDTTEDVYDAAVETSFGGKYALGWDANNHLLALTTKACAGGLGSLGGTEGGGSMVSGSGSAGGFAVPVAAHEFGHNLGLAHANAAICSTTSHDSALATFGTPTTPAGCRVEEYGDYLDIMGTSQTNALPHLSTPQKYAYGWLPSGITTVTDDITATIKPLGSTGTRALRVVDGTQVYYVEYRTSDLFDANSYEFDGKVCSDDEVYNTYQRCYGTVVAANGGVRIVRALPDQGGHPGTSVLAVGAIDGESIDAKRRDTHLGAGESFTNFDGAFTVSVTSLNTTTGANVSITFGEVPITPTTTTLSLTGTTSVYGSSAPTATATVVPASPGTVQFYDGATAIGAPVTVSGGAAALDLPKTLTAGTHSISAKYLPATDTYVTSSSDPQTVTATVPATVTLAAVANTGGPGIRVSASVALADGTTPSGSVQFIEGGGSYGSAPVNGGVASLNIPTIAAGNHSITAHYKPTKANYLEGATTAGFSVTQFVEADDDEGEDDVEEEEPEPVKTATKVTIKFVALKVKLAKKAVLNVTVSGSKPTGTITVLSKGKKIASFTLKAAAKGKAKITLPKFKKVGTYKITVKYSGSDLFKASTSKALNLKIVK